MNDHEINKAAGILFATRRSRLLFEGFPEQPRPKNERDAYLFQDHLLALFAESDSTGLAGHKIGSTTPVMQKYLGIDAPCAGRLRQSLTHRKHGSFTHPTQGALGVEREIAVRLERHLPPTSISYGRREVIEAVGARMATIEVVEDRYPGWRSLDTATLLAGNFFNTGAVLGGEFVDFDPLVLGQVTASMTIDGVIVGNGRSSDVRSIPWMPSRGLRTIFLAEA